ncbi:hypothetical protein [Nonomuraea maritima]|uniref:hypothetical protein n=1 Tax=Nonomuraea maritima TaxID=683260 RepID=UPI0037127811
MQPRISGPHTARRGYAVACGVAAAGSGCLALAYEATSASLAVLLAAGALPLTRSFGTIWVNSRTVGAVRATVHSLLAQAEYAGKIACGLAVAVIADLSGAVPALMVCGALLVIAIVIVQRSTW